MTAPTTSRLAYDDSATVAELWSDARRCGARLRGLERAAGRATGPTPSIRYDDLPREAVKRGIEVPTAARHLADALSLHLD